MSDLDAPDLDRRILVLTPTSKDGAISRSLLATSGITGEACPSFDALFLELERGAAAILIPEEAVTAPVRDRLRAVLSAQPAWSDLPILMLAYRGANSATSADAVRTLGNVTLLERPLQVTTFLSAVQTALRARERQYQIRGHLAERARSEESLRVADQRKDEFLATLGHELRNPLAPLLTGLQLLKSNGIDDHEQGRVTAAMERQINHLVRLVDDLLEVSRITRGLIDIQRGPLDLGSLVLSAVETSRSVVEAAEHELTIDVPLERVTVEGDPVRLTQVFANLLTNAAKYTNAGGHIWLSVRREGKRAVISVRDNGIGISPEHLASVFDMFTQVNRSSRQAQGGLGIGLTLVRSLVEMHGGSVEARSAGPGSGSEFIVELPVLAARAMEAEVSAALGPMPPRRILVVDDNRDAVDTLSSLLKSLGATVAVAHSGREALDLLPRYRPDAILLDIGMPDMDGYEVARRIRAMPSYASLLLIALTGWGQDQDFLRSHAAGFDYHLVKPPDINKLRRFLLEDWCKPPMVEAMSSDDGARGHGPAV